MKAVSMLSISSCMGTNNIKSKISAAFSSAVLNPSTLLSLSSGISGGMGFGLVLSILLVSRTA